MKSLISLVSLITNKIKTKEDKKLYWNRFKKENEDNIKVLLGLKNIDIERAPNLIDIDIDEENKLLLLNYTAQAHNCLHAIPGAWTPQLKYCRGLVFSFYPEVKIVSRSFEKFFNFKEVEETSKNNLTKICQNHQFLAREKADGHMIEFFEYNNKLQSTTRGRFGTASALESKTILSYEDWINVKNFYKSKNIELMSLVVELVTPNTEVLVDYNGETSLYLLAAFDVNQKIINSSYLSEVRKINEEIFALPEARIFTLNEIIKEINNRNIINKEGWVLNCGGERFIKFKYINYIGRMVMSKLNYKYIMSCILNNRLEKMLDTLNKEEQEYAYSLANNVFKILEDCKRINSYKPLYKLWSDEEGGNSYFYTVCRKFYRGMI